MFEQMVFDTEPNKFDEMDADPDYIIWLEWQEYLEEMGEESDANVEEEPDWRPADIHNDEIVW